MTPETKEYGECGNLGVSDLAAENYVNSLSCFLKGYKRQIELLETMGY